MSRIYRLCVSHLSNHIIQRAVYAGWSKFTLIGGADFAQEVQEWIETSSEALGPAAAGADESAMIAAKAPWKHLTDVGRILTLPTGVSGEDVTFEQAMAVAWSDGESYERFCERVDVALGKEELRMILRRRVECWR